MSKEERVEAVRAAMESGHSNASAAKELGTTSGTVAGIRYKNDIPSKHRAQGGTRRLKKEARKTAPPDADLPEPPDKPKPPYKLAASRFTACDAKLEDGRLCDYQREPGSKFCRLHNWTRKHPRR